jgi:plastocyanin
MFGVAALLAAWPADALAGGRISGQVTVVSGRDTVQREEVWVYLENQDRRQQRAILATKPPVQQITQKNRQFVPHFLVVPVGTIVTFPNNDHEYHNVFSPSDPAFDLGQYNTDPTGPSRHLDAVGDVEIYCDIHKDMWARIHVVDGSFITPVDKAGHFTIENVPPGRYKVRAWTYDSNESVEKVEVIAGTTTAVPTMNLHLDRLASSGWKPHVRKDGQGYTDLYH